MTLSKLFVASLILGCAPVAAHAAGKTPANPVALTTLDYSQNFDGLAASGTGNSALPDGFQVVETGSGSAADGFYRAGSGSSNAGDVYSFGNSADRALGSLASGSNDAIYFGAIFINRLDRIISDLRFAYTGEQWRAGSSNDDGLIFQLSTDASELDNGTWRDVDALAFTPLVLSGNTALNGNVNSVDIFGTIAGLSIADGASFGFRWFDSNSTGSDHGLAVDDLRITASLAPVAGAVPEPSTWLMLLLGFAMIGFTMRGAVRRSNKRFEATLKNVAHVPA